MKLSESIKPISYLKAHASEIVREVNENGKTFVITQNGYAKVVIYSVDEYENDQKRISSLKAELTRLQMKKKFGQRKLTGKAQIYRGQ